MAVRGNPMPVDGAEARLESSVTRLIPIDRDLAVRALAALRASLTTRGHLAQRVPHEGLGYCGHRSESPLCTAQRALIEELTTVVEGV